MNRTQGPVYMDLEIHFCEDLFFIFLMCLCIEYSCTWWPAEGDRFTDFTGLWEPPMSVMGP